jgi:putative intracellular protease/amidase
MHIAILTFEGFNELDSLVALGILNRIKKPGWRATLSCLAASVTSMNGVTVHAQSTLAEACAADAVVVGSGIRTREIANEPALMAKLALDPRGARFTMMAPVGEKEEYVSRAMKNIVPYLS